MEVSRNLHLVAIDRTEERKQIGFGGDSCHESNLAHRQRSCYVGSGQEFMVRRRLPEALFLLPAKTLERDRKEPCLLQADRSDLAGCAEAASAVVFGIDVIDEHLDLSALFRDLERLHVDATSGLHVDDGEIPPGLFPTLALGADLDDERLCLNVSIVSKDDVDFSMLFRVESLHCHDVFRLRIHSLVMSAFGMGKSAGDRDESGQSQ